MWIDETRELLWSQLRITYECQERSTILLINTIWEEIGHFHTKYSRFIAENTLADINSHVGVWQSIDKETFQHLEHVQSLQERYPGGFSLCIKTVLESLGYGVSHWSATVSTRRHNTHVRLRWSDELYIWAPIEFGGFGKGWALEFAATTLRHQVANCCLDFGGDLFAQGVNPQGKSWTIALESPLALDEAIGTLTLDGEFLAVSNPLKRRWGKHHHLIDPVSESPSQHWAGSYVRSGSGFEADFLATSLFCTSDSLLREQSEHYRNIRFLLVDPEGGIMQNNFGGQLF